jgi:hypothetical protein
MLRQFPVKNQSVVRISRKTLALRGRHVSRNAPFCHKNKKKSSKKTEIRPICRNLADFSHWHKT